MSGRGIVVAIALLAGVACAARQAPPPTAAGTGAPPQPEPTVELRCIPRIAKGVMFKLRTFTASLRVKNPDEVFWCPGVEWYVNNTRFSHHESDCEPYESVVARNGGPPEVWSEAIKQFHLPEGEYTIAAKLVRAGTVIARKECSVIAR
jgi:hypothetical protein